MDITTKRGRGRPRYLDLEPHPYAHRVTWERVNPASGRVEQVVSGCKGTRTHARANAMLKSNFMRIVKIEPLTEEQYNQEFPVETRGRTGRFVSLRA